MNALTALTAIGIVLCVFVIPLWIIFNYLGKAKVSGSISKEDEQMLEDLWKMSKEMENRIQNLETILEEGNTK